MTITDTHIPTTISTAVLDMALIDEHQQSVLRLGRGEQTLMLELRNRTDTPIELGDDHGTALNLTFRPGAMEGVRKVSASGAGWKGSMVPGRTELQTLRITRSATITLAPHSLETIMLKGLNPSAAGGSRATRVEIEYENVVLSGNPPISGRRHVHLALLHPEVPPGLVSGASGTSGPFKATVTSAGEILTGRGQNIITVALETLEKITVPAEGAGEVATLSLKLDAPRSTVQLVSNGSSVAEPWSAANDQITLDLSETRILKKGKQWIAAIQITTTAEPGLYPLVLRHENFQQTRGELVLLVRVTAIGVDATKGRKAELIAKRPLTVEGALTANSVRSTGDIHVKGRLRLAAGTEGWSNDQWALQWQSNMFNFQSQSERKTHYYFWDHAKVAEIAVGRPGSATPLSLGVNTRVGINTRDPKHTLDINGKTHINGELDVKGSTSTTRLHLGNGWQIYADSSNFYIMKSGQSGSVLTITSSGELYGAGRRVRFH